jgi:hypothetical protein
MAEHQTEAWGLVGPDWLSGRRLMPDAYRTREDAIRAVGSRMAIPGQTWRQGWRRAYRAGWRAVRVTIQTKEK